MTLMIEHLLQPISDEYPCGEDLSFSNEFHHIKKARTQDDLLLDQGDWVTAPKQADWNKVSDISMTLFSQKTKDIRLLTWLCEAQTQLHGFDGMVQTIQLSHQVLHRYWQNIHPIIEDDDLDQRLGLLQGFVNQIPPLIKKIPLVDNSPFYCFLEYESLQHQQNNKLKNKDEFDDDESSYLLELFEKSLSNTSQAFQSKTYTSFSVLLSEWQQLKSVLDALLGLDAPSFAQIDSQLENIDLTLKKLYKTHVLTHSLDTPSINTPSHSPEVKHKNEQIQFQPLTHSHLENREQAILVLKDIMNYFQKNEPHSPVSYMLQKTIRWSDLPLHEWLAQVIKNDQPLESIQELLGVQQHNESE